MFWIMRANRHSSWCLCVRDIFITYGFGNYWLCAGSGSKKMFMTLLREAGEVDSILESYHRCVITSKSALFRALVLDIPFKTGAWHLVWLGERNASEIARFRSRNCYIGVETAT